MRLFVSTTIVIALLCTSCGSGARDLGCVLTPAPKGVFQGVGTGDSALIAKAAAEADLCRAIRSEIDTRIEITEDERWTGQRAGYPGVTFDHSVKRTDAREAYCVFEGMPLVVSGEDVGGTACIIARLAKGDYQRYLAEHETAVDVLAEPGLPLDGLRGAIFAIVRRAGYVPNDAPLASTPFRSEAKVSVSIVESGVEGMKIARARLTVTTRSVDGRVAAHAEPPEVVVRGFGSERLLKEALASLAAALRGDAR